MKISFQWYQREPGRPFRDGIKVIEVVKASNGGKTRQARRTNRNILGDSPQKNHNKSGFLPGWNMSRFFVSALWMGLFFADRNTKKTFNISLVLRETPDVAVRWGKKTIPVP
jgi:hypothetical protein